jgi:hypothetical protein
MNGQGHWLTFAILLVAVSPLVALWMTGWLADRRYRVERSQVRCRLFDNKLVECAVVRDARTSEPIGISSCSARQNAEDVRCARSCLPLFTRAAHRAPAERAAPRAA